MTYAPPMAVTELTNLTGRVALVTGASGNIGAGIARRLHEAGAAVILHGAGRLARAEALAGELGPRAVAAGGDVVDDAPDLCAAAVSAFGRLDIVVNNAGLQPVAPLLELTDADIAEMLRVNVAGVAAMTREAARVMAANDVGPAGRGAVVNVASIEGLQPAHGHSHYAASKAAVLQHTRAAALELGPVGIRVNAVSPGLIDVEGLAQQWPEGVARWHHAAPLGRLGDPSDVADAVLFLAGLGARWVTGANLVVDGGVLTHNTW